MQFLYFIIMISQSLFECSHKACCKSRCTGTAHQSIQMLWFWQRRGLGRNVWTGKVYSKNSPTVGALIIITVGMFSFGPKIVPPDLAWCGWCTQLRGIILSLLYALLNIYVINAVKSIRSIKYIENIHFGNFSNIVILYVHHPLHSGTEPSLPKMSFCGSRKKGILTSTSLVCIYILCGCISDWKHMTQLSHGCEYFISVYIMSHSSKFKDKLTANLPTFPL